MWTEFIAEEVRDWGYGKMSLAKLKVRTTTMLLLQQFGSLALERAKLSDAALKKVSYTRYLEFAVKRNSMNTEEQAIEPEPPRV